MNIENQNDLPTLGKPPVVEVVMGVQFETLENFSIPHVGLLWDNLDREKYPTCEEVAPIITPDDHLVVFDKPIMPRIWFIEKNDNAVVQFQRNRFLYNWRTSDSKSEYPRYKYVKEEFYNSVEKLEKCLLDLKIETINPQRLELTYINVIPIDNIGGVHKIGSILKDISWGDDYKELQKPQKIEINWQFLLKEINSLLDVRIKNVTLPITSKEVLRMELTVRGQAQYRNMKECSPWFDTARRAIVKGFIDITTSNAHNMWGGLSYE